MVKVTDVVFILTSFQNKNMFSNRTHILGIFFNRSSACLALNSTSLHSTLTKSYLPQAQHHPHHNIYQLDGPIDEWTNGRMDGWKDGRMDGWTDGRMDGWTDGRMDGWTDGWMDGWIDGWMDTKITAVILVELNHFLVK